MDSKLEKQIISEYKKGKSSLEIVKIVNLSKPTILSVLHKHNLVRKRDRCKKLTYEFDGEYYILYRTCPSCGNQVPTKSKHKTIACRNHLNKINENTDCRECSLLKQHGKGNPFYGKKHTKKTKNKISKSRKGKATGKDNAMANPKHRSKAIKKLKEKWDSGEMEHARKIMSDTMKLTISKGKLKSIIKSKAETEIKNLIEEMGFSVVSSYRVKTKTCDLYVPDLNLIIEYNGDYWHCNPNKYSKNYYNQKKSKYAWEIWEYDQNKIDLLNKLNYNVEVIWEQDYNLNKNIIKEVINTHAKKTRHSTLERDKS